MKIILSGLFGKFKKKYFIPLGLLIFFLIIGGFFVWQKYQLKPVGKAVKIRLTSEADITLVPTQKDASGVGTKSSFILSSKSPLKKNTLLESFKIIPQVSFKLKEKNSQSWEITPQEPLEKGKIYRFILSSLIGDVHAQELSWAFQIQTPLEITGSLPADKATEIPLNASIEIYFNNPEFINGENYFEINPQVEGRFEKHQNTLVFLPKNLNPATIYTVKIKQGLPLKDNSSPLSEDFIFQFETSDEEKQPVTRFEFSRFLFEINPGQTPFLLLNNWQPPTNLTKAKLFQFNQEQFLDCLKKQLNLPVWSRYARFSYSCPPSNLPLAEFDLEPRQTTQNGQYYFELPEPLAKGFYLFQVENPNTSPSQALIEVTPLSWYFWLGGKETLFWVNHLETKSPASGAIISDENGQVGQTDDNGLLKIQTLGYLKEKKNTLLTISHGAEKAFVPVNFSASYSSWFYSYSESKNQIMANDYWSYLYHDRQIYLPTDKVQFWGLVKPRQNQGLKKITVKLVKDSFNPWEDDLEKNVTLIAEKEINLSPTGTFIADFELQNLPPSWYSLGIFADGIFVNQTGFSIKTFHKPAYRILALPEKVAIWAGEKNEIKINASFWDKTPLANTTLVWNRQPDNAEGEVTTNAAGEASLEINTTYDASREYWPQIWTVNLHPKLPEEAEIETSVSFFAFGPNIALGGQTKWENDQGQVAVNAQKLDINKLQENPWQREGEPVTNLKIKAEAYRYWYEKIETGEHYNPIDKIVEKEYRYEERSEKVQEEELTTNEKGEASFNFTASENQSYRIFLAANDDQGRTAKFTLYLWAGQTIQAEGFNLTANKDKFKVGEKAIINLENNGEPVPENPPNRYLLLGLQNGKVILSQTQTGHLWEFEFQSQFIPNILVKSVWFNGLTYQENRNWGFWRGEGLNLTFDSSEKNLKIELQPEKEKYRPGEEAKLKLMVTNPGGQPEKARVLISAVDEALSNLGGIITPNVLENLYQSLGEGKLLSYLSHPQPKMQAQAEGGGGGGARENFENTALFTEVETDGNGQAEVKFKLPDNITTWRATTVAISSDLKAGESQFLLPVTKPIFVSLITAEEFLINDQAKLSAVAFGEILDSETAVSFTLKAPSLGVKEQTFKEKAFIPIEFDLPKMILGEHKIEVWAEAKGEKDGIIRTIKVIDSRLIREKAEFVDLDDEFTPSWQTQKAVIITVIDKGRGYWYPKLHSLAQLSWFGKNERVDRLAGEMKAKELLKQYFGDQLTIDNDLTAYQKQGLTLLPYGDEDLIVSAKIANLNPLQIDKNELKKYFWKIFNQEKSIERASAALWGLAALDEPVLNTIGHLLDQENTSLGKLYLGLAAGASADQGTAREVWQSLVNQFGIVDEPYVYLQIGNNKEEYLQATALGMVLAGQVSQELTESMWQYLDDNPSQENIYVSEKAILIQSILERTICDLGSFEYWLDNKKVTKQLDAGQSQQILIPPSQISGFRLKPISGNLGLVAHWWEKFDPETIKKTPLIQVNLTANPQDRLSADQTMEILLNSNIDPNALAGGYLITVNLPSGLRYIESAYQWQPEPSPNFYYSWPSFEEGNHLVFWRFSNDPVRFLARPVNKGAFIFEPVIIYHGTAVDYLNLSPKPSDVVIE